MSAQPAPSDGVRTHALRGGVLLIARVGLVALATTIAWLVMVGVDGPASFPPSPLLASLSLLPVNIVSLWLVARFLRSEGQDLRSLFIPARRPMLRETGWGLLWILVLYLPFVAAIMGTMWALHGPEMFTAFETVFFDPQAATIAHPGWGLALGIIAVLTFAPLNAPAEEAVFRGYSQSRLLRRWSVLATVLLCSLAFGAQHAFFAPTADAMIVYVVAFTVWGIGSALIVLRQKRLLPITIAHFIVNLLSSSPAVIFPMLQLTGLVPR